MMRHFSLFFLDVKCWKDLHRQVIYLTLICVLLSTSIPGNRSLDLDAVLFLYRRLLLIVYGCRNDGLNVPTFRNSDIHARMGQTFGLPRPRNPLRKPPRTPPRACTPLKPPFSKLQLLPPWNAWYAVSGGFSGTVLAFIMVGLFQRSISAYTALIIPSKGCDHGYGSNDLVREWVSFETFSFSVSSLSYAVSSSRVDMKFDICLSHEGLNSSKMRLLRRWCKLLIACALDVVYIFLISSHRYLAFLAVCRRPRWSWFWPRRYRRCKGRGYISPLRTSSPSRSSSVYWPLPVFSEGDQRLVIPTYESIYSEPPPDEFFRLLPLGQAEDALCVFGHASISFGWWWFFVVCVTQMWCYHVNNLLVLSFLFYHHLLRSEGLYTYYSRASPLLTCTCTVVCCTRTVVTASAPKSYCTCFNLHLLSLLDGGSC